MAEEQIDNKTPQPETKQAVYSTRDNRLNSLRESATVKLPPSVKLSSWRHRISAFALIVGLIAGMVGGLIGARIYTTGISGTSTVSTAAKKQYISDTSALIASIAKSVGTSVVSVDVTSQTQTPDFFGFPQTTDQQSAGTGFIISSSGLIVTNRHVIPDGTTSVSVTLVDGTRYDNVQVVGRSPNTSSQDIAFLKISNLKGKTLSPVTLGDSSKMQVGDQVIAIGNALGQFQNTVTTGIISGFGRDVTAGDSTGSGESLTDLFQTDAAINEGNSGGPLVNIDGEVIGINTAVASGAQNIGFAQPINDLAGDINSVLSSGKLAIPYLGVRYISLTNDIAYEFNLNVNRGAYVISSNNEPAVVSGGPAAKAGVKEHDIITRVNNIKVDSNTSLSGALSHFKPGDKVVLYINRAGKNITIHVTLGNTP